MRRLKLYVALAFSQAVLFYFTTVEYQTARAAEASKEPQSEELERSPGRPETPQGELETSHGKHETSNDAPAKGSGKSAAGAEAPLNVAFDIPQLQVLQYPYAASANHLSRDATYVKDGVAYKYVGRRGNVHAFDNLEDGSRSTYSSVDMFVVTDDPARQVEKDIAAVQKIREEGRRLFSLSSTYLSEFDTIFRAFRAAVVSARSQDSEEAFRGNLEKAEEAFDRLQTAYSTLKAYQTSVEAGLRQGLILCQNIKERAEGLIDGLVLVRRISALERSLHDDVTTLTVEQTDYAEARQDAEEHLTGLRRILKLMSDLQEVAERSVKSMDKLTLKKGEIESVVQQIEELNERIVTVEVGNRQLRAAQLKEAHARFSEEIEKFTAESSVLTGEMALLKPLKARCEAYTHEDVPVFIASLNRFRAQAEEVQTLLDNFERLLQRAAGAVETLKVYGESYEVLDTDLLHQGLYNLKQKIQESDKAYGISSGLKYKVSEQALNLALKSLVDRVKAGDLSALPGQLQAVQRQRQVFRDSAEAAEKELKSQLEVLRGMEREAHRLEAFVHNAEDKKELEAAAVQVQIRIHRADVRRKLIQTSAEADTHSAVLEQALTLPLERAELYLSNAEAKQETIKAKLQGALQDPDVAKGIREACATVSDEIMAAQSAFKQFVDCKDSEGIRLEASKKPSHGGRSLYEKLSQRSSEFTRKAQAIAHALAGMTEALESKKEEARLAKKLREVIAAVQFHAEKLKQAPPEEGEPAEQATGPNEVERSLDALESSLSTSGFGSAVNTLMQNTLKAALTIAASHVAKAVGAEKMAAQIEALEVEVEQAEDPTRERKDIPSETLKASHLMQQHVSFATAALMVYESFAEIEECSEIVQNVPFAQDGIDEQSFAAAAQVLKTKARMLQERARIIFHLIDKHQAYMRRYLQTHLKRMMQALETGMNNLKSKAELAKTEEQKAHILEQVEEYKTARSAVSACMSLSTLQLEDAQACFSSSLRLVVSRAAIAAERAKALQKEAEDTFEETGDRSSVVDADNSERVTNACNRAMQEVDLVREALNVCGESTGSVFSKNIAAQASGIGKNMTLEEDTQMLGANMHDIVERVEDLRKRVHERYTAAVRTLQTRAAQVLEIVQRGSEDVRGLAQVDTSHQKVFVSIATDLEEMLASVKFTEDIPKNNSFFEAGVQKMVKELLDLAEGRLKLVESEKARMEACVRGIESCAPPLFTMQEERELKASCDKLLQLIKLINVTLNVCQQLEGIEGLPVSPSVERRKQLLALSAALEAQLRPLCEAAIQRFNAVRQDANERLTLLKTVLGETLHTPGVTGLPAIGDPFEVIDRIKHYVESSDILLSNASSSTFPAEARERETTTLKFLVDVSADLQKKCQQYLAEASDAVQAPFPTLLLTVDSQQLENDVLYRLFRCQRLADAAKALLTAHKSLAKQPSITREGASDTGVSERATYDDCIAQAQQIEEALSALPKKLTAKMKAMEQSALQVVKRVVEAGERAATKLDAEEAAGAEEDVRLNRAKDLLKKGVSELKTCEDRWGQEAYAEKVRTAIGDVLAALLQTTQMHVEAAKAKIAELQKCLGESAACVDPEQTVSVEQALPQAYKESKMTKHVTAAREWIGEYADCNGAEDTRDVSNNTTAQPGGMPLSEWEATLLMDIRSLEDTAKQYPEHIEQRRATLSQLARDRLRELEEVLREGVNTIEDVVGSTGEVVIATEGFSLKGKVEKALSALGELTTRRHSVASPTENQEYVAGVLRMLVAHAADLMEKCRRKEQEIAECLQNLPGCSVSQTGDIAGTELALKVDSIVGYTKVSSVALKILTNGLTRGFIEAIAKHTHLNPSDPSSALLLERAAEIWKEVEYFEKNIPSIATQVRAARWQSSYQGHLAKIVSLISESFKNLPDDDPAAQRSAQERSDQADALIETIQGLYGATVPYKIESAVAELLKTVIEEATKYASLAKESLETAERVINADTTVITTSFSTSVKAAAEAAVEAGYQRASSAALLLSVVDPVAGLNREVRGVLERVAGAQVVTAAERLLAEAGSLSSRSHKLRAHLRKREEITGAMAVQSLEALIQVAESYIAKLDLEASTRQCHAIALPSRDRLLAVLGLLKALHQTWSFPSSLEEYLPLLHSCVSEFLRTTTDVVSAAEDVGRRVRELTLQAGPRLGITGSTSEEIEAKALHRQGKDYLHVASVLLGSVWEALAAGEVKQTELPTTTLLAVDMAARETLVNDATSLGERIDKTTKQLSISEMEQLRRAHRELLVEVCRDRINHIVKSFEKAIDGLAERRQGIREEDQNRKAEIDEMIQIYGRVVSQSREFRESCSTSVVMEDIHQSILESLSICLRTVQRHMDEADTAAMEVAVCLSHGEALSAASEQERLESQTKTAIFRALNFLFLARTGLDTFQNCARVASIGWLAQTNSDTPDGPSFAEHMETLFTKAIDLAARVEGMTADFLQRQNIRKRTASQSEPEAVPTRIPEMKISPVSVGAPVASATSQQETELDVAAELKRRLDRVARHLREAEESRIEFQKCVADDDRCENLLATGDDVSSASDTVYVKLLKPVLTAELELSLLQRLSAAGAGEDGVDEQATPKDAIAGEEERREPRSLTLAVKHGHIHPSFRAWLENVDPSADLVVHVQELIAKTLKARAAASQTSLTVRAVLVLRRLVHILDNLIDILAYEQSTCRCGERDHLVPVTEEYRMLSINLALLRSMFGSQGCMQEYVPLLEGYMHKLLEDGDTSVSVAKQAAETAEEFLDEAVPAGLSHVTLTTAKVEQAVETAVHQVHLARIFIRTFSEVVEAASLLKLSEETALYNRAAALAPLTRDAARIAKQADTVDAMLRGIRERLESRRQHAPTDAKTSIEALIETLEKTAFLLDRSIPQLKSSTAKAVAQSLKGNSNTFLLSLRIYLQEPNFPVSPFVFATSVTAVGRSINEDVEDALNQAEGLKANVVACVSEEGIRTPCGGPQENACSEVAELVAVSHIGLDANDSFKDNRLLQLVLSKPPREPHGRASVLERTSALRRRANTLQASLLTLVELMFNKFHGSGRSATTQKELLSQAIIDALTTLEQIQWRAAGSQPAVESTKKQLHGLLAELGKMGDKLEERSVHDVAAKAFKAALKLASDLSAEAQKLLGRANKSLSGRRENTVLTGDEIAEMQLVKQQARYIRQLMELAKAVLHLSSLHEREDCFYGVAQNEHVTIPPIPGVEDVPQSRTVKAEGDHLKARVEHLHAFAGILEEQVLEREKHSLEACENVLQLLLKAMYKGIEEASERQVPDDVDVEKTGIVNLLSRILEGLQDMRADWGFPTSLEELQRAASTSLVPLLNNAATAIERSEQQSAEGAHLLRNLDPSSDGANSTAEDVLAAVRNAEAHAALAEAALNTVFTCTADSLMREALIKTPMKVASGTGREDSVPAIERADGLFKRLTDVKTANRSIREQASGIIVDATAAAETMLSVLREAITRLSGAGFHSISMSLSQKRAALEERLQVLQEAVQSATREDLRTAVTREIAAAVEDVTQCLADIAYQRTAESVQNKLEDSLKGLLVSVEALVTEAKDLMARCGGVAEAVNPTELVAFFEKAERVLNGDIRLFSAVGKDLIKAQQRIALQSLYAEVYCATAEEYLDVEGLEQILEDAAREGLQVPSTAVLENILKTVAPDYVDDTKAMAEEVARRAMDFESIATREEGKVKQAVAQVLPVQLDRFRLLTANLLAEEAASGEQLNALLRLTTNAVNKHEGKPLTPASGSGADVGLPNEEQMSASQLLREAAERHAALIATLKKLMSETDEVLVELDGIISLLQRVANPAPKSPFDQQRRLSDANTIEAAIPIFEHMKSQLFLLRARLLQMENKAYKAMKKSSNTLSRSAAKATGGQKQPGYLALGLGLGLPLALLAVGGCAYCHYRRGKRREISDLTTVTSASDLHGNTGAPEGTGDIQVSRYDFVEPDGVFAAVEPPELKEVRTLTSLETPEAGIPDTTQRQYMVDEHHVVATQLKEEAMKKEQKFERPIF